MGQVNELAELPPGVLQGNEKLVRVTESAACKIFQLIERECRNFPADSYNGGRVQWTFLQDEVCGRRKNRRHHGFELGSPLADRFQNGALLAWNHFGIFR